MELKINLENAPFKISSKLISILITEINKAITLTDQQNEYTLSFKDESYSAELGGYHPVEIHIVKIKGVWKFDYITDFCFVGSGQDAQLTKEIDFDFTSGLGFQLYAGDDDLKFFSELYKVWESNFISYFESGVFKVKVTIS